MRIRLLESALRDLAEGSDFYEQRSPGLGQYFLDSLAADLRSLQIYAGIHEVVRGFHRALSERFPYAIYYSVQNDQVSVYAILDCRRDPRTIERRLADEQAGRDDSSAP